MEVGAYAPPFSCGPSNTEGEGKREQVPGDGESAEVRNDSREENLVVPSYREKPHSGMGRQGVKGPGS